MHLPSSPCLSEAAALIERATSNMAKAVVSLQEEAKVTSCNHFSQSAQLIFFFFWKTGFL